jgi:hypothetical protein
MGCDLAPSEDLVTECAAIHTCKAKYINVYCCYLDKDGSSLSNNHDDTGPDDDVDDDDTGTDGVCCLGTNTGASAVSVVLADNTAALADTAAAADDDDGFTADEGVKDNEDGAKARPARSA